MCLDASSSFFCSTSIDICDVDIGKNADFRESELLFYDALFCHLQQQRMLAAFYILGNHSGSRLLQRLHRSIFLQAKVWP